MSRAILRVCLFVGVAGCATTGKPNPLDGGAIPQFNPDSLTTELTGDRVYALVGSVVDSASGRPVPRAIVTASVNAVEKPAYAFTDDSGGFVLGRLQPGHYRILVRRIGYMPFNSRRDGIAGKIDTVRVRLRVNPYGELTTAVIASPQSCFASDTASVRIIARLQELVTGTSPGVVKSRAMFHLPSFSASQVTLVTDDSSCVRARQAEDSVIHTNPRAPATIPARQLYVVKVGTYNAVVDLGNRVEGDVMLSLSDPNWAYLGAFPVYTGDP
jgi:hypothetical protein